MRFRSRPDRRPTTVLLSLVVLVSASVCGGCGGKRDRAAESQVTPTAPPEPTPQPRPRTPPAIARRGNLYERIGGESIVRAVIDDFVSRAAADPAVNFTREGHPNHWEATPENLERLKQRLVEFVATLAGGPMQYRGNDMVTAHRGMAITNKEFDALADHLAAAMQAHDVPRREREELMNAVASMRSAIVEAADAPPAEAPPAEAPNADAATPEGAQAETPPTETDPDATAPAFTPPEEAKPDDAPPQDAPAEQPTPSEPGQTEDQPDAAEPEKPALDAPAPEDAAPDDPAPQSGVC